MVVYPRKNGKSERSLIEFIEWVESIEETPVDYVEVAKQLRKNRKGCAEWLRGKDTFWIVGKEGANDERPDKP